MASGTCCRSLKTRAVLFEGRISVVHSFPRRFCSTQWAEVSLVGRDQCHFQRLSPRLESCMVGEGGGGVLIQVMAGGKAGWV